MTELITITNTVRRGCRAAGLLGIILYFAPLSAHAQATQITSSSGLAAGDTMLTYTITDDTFVSSYTGNAGGSTLTFTDAGQSLYEAQQGPNDFSGAFPNGTNLLATLDAAPDGTANPAGPLTITFAPGVTQFGLSAQNVFFGSEVFTFTPFSGATSLGAFTVGPLLDTGPTGLVFLGAKVGSGSITSVKISSTSSVSGKNNIFVVGPVTFATAAPEPSSVAAVSMGILGIGALALRARRRSVA